MICSFFDKVCKECALYRGRHCELIRARKEGNRVYLVPFG